MTGSLRWPIGLGRFGVSVGDDVEPDHHPTPHRLVDEGKQRRALAADESTSLAARDVHQDRARAARRMLGADCHRARQGAPPLCLAVLEVLADERGGWTHDGRGGAPGARRSSGTAPTGRTASSSAAPVGTAPTAASRATRAGPARGLTTRPRDGATGGAAARSISPIPLSPPAAPPAPVTAPPLPPPPLAAASVAARGISSAAAGGGVDARRVPSGPGGCDALPGRCTRGNQRSTAPADWPIARA